MNSGFTQEKVDKLADLLLIGLTEEENKMVFEEFEIIDTNINKINEIKGIKEVKPMTHTLDDFVCVLRDDEAEESIPLDDLLANSDDTEDGCVSVPKVVG
ncbi:MAG: Asp-tRNA(Asn)/Glu-tRNA(Gln) amidotransferase subunit GatC [Bacilli bacterium]|nr:Asp-tRNA(Asn)/Glu-tRNA(Gln) amidotransferase subunit GatC [Bacilli bacterium]MDE6141819.1 Asp-tRNA(Asn)/Glu-tRNA(Gln) amidotransferase subunit GatC [Bacilli bacterium]